MPKSPQNSPRNASKHIHIIGICGVATSALAIAFHRDGWTVTGSDKGFYPPVSTYLNEAGIKYHAGWHPELIGTPDIIVAGGGGTSLSNPEVMYAKAQGIPLLSFAEALGQYVVKKNSIVTAGTWGKTTTSALLSFILIEAGMNPSYFTGGLSMSHDTGAITDTDWSVVEGDEYQIAIWDKRPKFACYSPTHLLLTSISWDHADLYPTEKAYFEVFEKLVSQAKKIVACTDDEGVNTTVKKLGAKITSYGGKNVVGQKADYYFHSVTHTKAGISFTIDHTDEKDGGQKKSYQITSPMLGRFNAENIAGCFTVAHEIGIAPEKIVSAIAKFKGIKRRLERRYEGDVSVLDCHAPTAEKAASVLESIREVFDKKIITIYEPNIGGRQKSSIAMYDKAFKNADIILIPRLTKLKIDESKKGASDTPLEGNELAEYMKKSARPGQTIEYVDDDEMLVGLAVKSAEKGDVIAFLGSHGFRGMIEAVISLHQRSE